jgi:hypothetical protein
MAIYRREAEWGPEDSVEMSSDVYLNAALTGRPTSSGGKLDGGCKVGQIGRIDSARFDMTMILPEIGSAPRGSRAA